MASSQRTVDFLLEQAAGAGSVSARKMFGEYALYCGGVVVGLVCDDELFLKDTPAGRSCLDRVVEGAPYPGAKPHLRVGAECWEDADFLARLIRATLKALPAARAPSAKPKAASKAKAAPKPKAAAKPAAAVKAKPKDSRAAPGGRVSRPKARPRAQK